MDIPCEGAAPRLGRGVGPEIEQLRAAIAVAPGLIVSGSPAAVAKCRVLDPTRVSVRPSWAPDNDHDVVE